MESVLFSAIDPETMTAFLVEQPKAGENGGSAPPGSTDSGTGTKGPEVSDGHTQGPASGTSGQAETGAHDAGDAERAPGADVGQGIAMEHCLSEIEKGNPDVAVVYFRVYKEQGAGAVFERLGSFDLEGVERGLAVVKTLETLAKGAEIPESVAHTAADMLYSISQSDANDDIRSAAGTAYFLLEG
jgi:hypothetical protein